MSTYTMLLIALFISNGGLIFAQHSTLHNTYYYPEDLDYLPHFVKYSTCPNAVYDYNVGFELTDVLENIVNSCSLERFTISSFTGDRLSGVMPKPLAENPWIVIDVDSLGNAHCETVNGLYERDDVKEKLNASLVKCKLNPGLLNSKPVLCRLIFILHKV